jgi:putative transposase
LAKVTIRIAQCYAVVTIEDLNMMGMIQNHCLALSLSDAASGRWLDLLETKVTYANGLVVMVDRFCPTSKRCVSCGKVEGMPPVQRTFACPARGVVAVRDHNAAMTVLKTGWRMAVEYSLIGRGCVGRKTPPQTGHNLDAGGLTLAAPDPGWVSERQQKGIAHAARTDW